MFLKLKRNLLKKFCALLCLFCFIVGGFSGCGPSGKEWVARVGEEEINFSDFLLMTSSKIPLIERKMKKNYFDFRQFTIEDFVDAEIEGISAFEYLKDEVEKEVEDTLISRLAARKLDLKLTPEDRKKIISQGKEQFDKLCKEYQAHDGGISRKTCIRSVEDEVIKEKILQELIGKGKEHEVTEEKIKDFANNESKSSRYVSLRIPKDLEKKNEEKKDDEKKKDDEENKDNEEKEKSEVKLIKKHFNVDTTKDLVDVFLKKLTEEGKSFEDCEKELKDAFGDSSVTKQEAVSYLEQEDEEDVLGMGINKESSEIKKNLKEMKKDEVKTIELKSNFCIIKKLSMNEETIEKEKDSIKSFLEENARKKFMDGVRKEYEKEIEKNEKLLSVEKVEEQVKYVLSHRVVKEQVPGFMSGLSGLMG